MFRPCPWRIFIDRYDRGELALILKTDNEGKPQIVGYKLPGGNEEEFDEQEVIATYLSASVDLVKLTNQELFTLETHLTEVIGPVESEKVTALHQATEAMRNEAEVHARGT